MDVPITWSCFFVPHKESVYKSLGTCKHWSIFLTKPKYTHINTSVDNAAVYPPNWATLKSPAVGLKPVGWVA